MTPRPQFLDPLGRDLAAKRDALVRRRRRRRAIGGVATAAVIFAIAGWALTGTDENGSIDRSTVAATSPTVPATASTAPTPSTDDTVATAPQAAGDDWRWHPVPGLSQPDHDPNQHSTIAWADDRIFVWSADGASMFDPLTSKRTPTAPPPVGFLSGRTAVWTGTELVLVGGYPADSSATTQAVAYDPALDQWRVLPESPVAWRSPVVSVWTGTEVVVWGDRGIRQPATPSAGAAYDPATDTWRTTAPAPLHLNMGNGVWTGEQVLVVASGLDQWNAPRTPTQLLTYDPTTDEWSIGEPPPLSTQAMYAVWTGELIAWDYELRAVRLDAATDSWVELPDAPLDFRECYPGGTTIGPIAVMVYCDQFAAFDPASGSWQTLPDLLEPGGVVTAPDRLLHFTGDGAALLVQTS